MKRYIWAILVFLLLTGCQGQPPELTETAEPTATPELTATPEPVSVLSGVEVDIGDGEHSFWVELTEREEDIGGIWVNIYRNKGDTEPFQQFEDHVLEFYRAQIIAEDVDFDGRTDFHFEQDWGSLPVFWHSYYIWDTDEERFVPDPYGLHYIPNAEFWPYSQEIVSATRVQEYYQYKDGALALTGEEFRPVEGSGEIAYKARYVTVDDTRTFWVKLVDTGHFGAFEIQIYSEKDDTQPLQTLEGNCETDFLNLYWSMEDMDFDGYGDLAVLYGEAPNGHGAFSYYIWAENEERFIPDPYGLNELGSLGLPELLLEEKTIRTFLRWRAGSEGEIRLYRYLKEGLTCVRYMSWQWREATDERTEGMDFLVENYENGEMKTVYKETRSMESLDGYLWSEEFERWYDPDYHGE